MTEGKRPEEPVPNSVQPNPMPEWLERQFDAAERTVAGWPDGKYEAAFRSS